MIRLKLVKRNNRVTDPTTGKKWAYGDEHEIDERDAQRLIAELGEDMWEQITTTTNEEDEDGPE